MAAGAGAGGEGRPGTAAAPSIPPGASPGCEEQQQAQGAPLGPFPRGSCWGGPAARRQCWKSAGPRRSTGAEPLLGAGGELWRGANKPSRCCPGLASPRGAALSLACWAGSALSGFSWVVQSQLPLTWGCLPQRVLQGLKLPVHKAPEHAAGYWKMQMYESKRAWLWRGALWCVTAARGLRVPFFWHPTGRFYLCR